MPFHEIYKSVRLQPLKKLFILKTRNRNHKRIFDFDI